jgi:hypothetical protein
MADNLPSPTPEKPGNNESAANAPDDQRKDIPKEKIKTPKQKSKKWLGLTEAKRRELFGFVMLVPWVWVDMVDCHSFFRLCGYAVSLAVAQFVVFSFFRNRLSGWTHGLWLISLLPLAFLVWSNSRPLSLSPPILSAKIIPLCDGKNFPDNEISIFNPNGVTLYWTTLEIIPNTSISPASLDIEADQPPEAERSLQRGPILDFFRLNRYPSPRQPKCKGVEIQLRTIPPLSYRFLRIDGTANTNSSATISIVGYTNRLNIISPNIPNSPNFSGFTPQMQLQYAGAISNLSFSSHSNAVFNMGVDFIAQ